MIPNTLVPKALVNRITIFMIKKSVKRQSVVVVFYNSLFVHKLICNGER